MPKFLDLSSIPSRVRGLLVSHVLASLILIASLVLVIWFWRSAQERGMYEAKVAFESSSEEAVELLRQRLLGYELLVRGGASLQTSLPQPNRRLWQQYVAGLDIEGRFPSVRALGFALAVEPSQLGALQYALPGMARGSAAATNPSGGKNAIVLYLAPEGRAGEIAVGSDLATRPVLQAAMQQAARSGELLLSAPIDSGTTQDQRSRIVTLFAPVYASGTDVPPEQRDVALRGWVFANVNITDFVSTALQMHDDNERMRIVDVSGEGAAIVYADEDYNEHVDGDSDPSMHPAFTHSGDLEMMGRHWRVEFESPPLATVREGIPGLTSTLVSGLLGTLLIVGIAFTLARTQSRANALAERMTQSYRRSEQRFRSAMRYSAIGKALLDQGGNILEANPSLAQILGSTPDALVGTALWDHFVDSHENALRTTQRETMGEDGAYRTTRRLQRSDGDVRHASLVFSAVPGKKEDDDFSSLVQVEDVTERLRAEARVQALNRTLEARVALRTRELSQANKELESFAYSVSHDLRAPLRSIDGFSRLLADRYKDTVDASGQDYIKRIRSSTLRMSDLIDALLKMSRVSRGEMKYEAVDIGQLAQTAAAELGAGDTGRHVVMEVEDNLQATGDPSLLQNLVGNLVGNAWKFTRDAEQARIRVGRNDAGEFFVQDNGAGFSQEYAQKLFRPFQRLHTQDEYPGHGIGLATVKRIVERHGGTIRAEGQAGQGATFYFTVPENPEAD